MTDGPYVANVSALATPLDTVSGVTPWNAAQVALTKPRIIELLLVTSVPTMILAAQGLPSGRVAVAVIAEGMLAAGLGVGFLALVVSLRRGVGNNETVAQVNKRALRLFHGSITYLSLLFLAIALSPFVP